MTYNKKQLQENKLSTDLCMIIAGQQIIISRRTLPEL